jgi:hypothetical protein
LGEKNDGGFVAQTKGSVEEVVFGVRKLAFAIFSNLKVLMPPLLRLY